jgi:hypothetical protein
VQAERAQFGPKVAREDVAFIDLSGAGRDFIDGEIANRLADRIRRFAEVKIESARSIGNGHANSPAIAFSSEVNGFRAKKTRQGN